LLELSEVVEELFNGKGFNLNIIKTTIRHTYDRISEVSDVSVNYFKFRI